MSKTQSKLLVLSVFLVGLAIGGVMTFLAMDKFVVTRSITDSAIARGGMNVVLLKALHAGETSKAISLLETDLDSSLVVLGLVPVGSIDEAARRFLVRASEYRAKSPYKSGDAVVDAAVADVLRGASK